jgi:hypothetical protein
MLDTSRFQSDFPESSKIRARDLIRLIPFGLSLAPDMNRPLLLLKSETSDHTLPVALNPLEAGVALTQFNKSTVPVTPHKVSEVLLQSLDIKIEKCVFVEIKGHFQYVRLFLKGHPHMKSLKFRADEAMSLCLHLNVEFYATHEFMNASRALNIQVEAISKDMKMVMQEKGSGYIQ